MHSDYKYETVINRMLGGPVGPSHRGRQLTSYPSGPPAAALWAGVNAAATYVTTNVKHVFKCSSIKMLFLIIFREYTIRTGSKWKNQTEWVEVTGWFEEDENDANHMALLSRFPLRGFEDVQ